MVGGHISFGNGATFEMFQHRNTLRAIKDEVGYEVTIDPRLHAGHPYQQHRQPHDPPASSSITYFPLDGLRPLTPALNFSSVSSFAKNAIICHFKDTHQIHTCTTESSIDKHADNGRLSTIMTQSPHMPVGGCTTTVSSCASGVRSYYRLVVLTNASHPFVAWISFILYWNVGVVIETSEPAVCGVGRAFKDRFPRTTRLARVVLGAVISATVFDR
mmetsp:Transcript_25048/g.72315  ORF Transcript_25048/g.72315 Transcript_25048/m.72315 type:complete len:216 (-) Transcript_25048:203-850(-)